MELKTLQKELHRLSELASAWQTADDITTIERDLMLARLRDLYEALRFGVGQSKAVTIPVVAPVEAEGEVPAEEIPMEEPLMLEADDFFSLEGILPVEEPAEPEAIEEAPVVEEQPEPAEEEQPEPVVEEEIAEEVAPAEEESAPVVEMEEAAPEVQEEVAPVVEEKPVPAIEEVAPKAEEPVVNTFATLFGAEPATDPHRRKQRVIMSLYDAPEAAPKPEPKPEPKVIPEEPMVEEEPIVEVVEEAEEFYVTPVEEVAESDDEVIEVSEEELEHLPESRPKSFETKTTTADKEDVEVLVEPAEEQPKTKSEPESVVLGEVMQPKTTLGDQLAAKQTVNDLRPRVTDLRRAVGLNDKFLLIRDLFGGNGSLYEITIRKLNEFDNFDDCMIYIAEHFAWNPNSDGAKLMLDLLERKFDQQ